MEGTLVVLLGLALMLAGPTLSRKGAAWLLRNALRRERKHALAKVEKPVQRRYALHRRIVKGPNNLFLAGAFQLTDFLHGAAWTTLLFVAFGGGDELAFALVAYAFSYFFICLLRWPIRRVVQEVANYVRSKWEGKPTLPFYQETLMLWRELAPVAYAGLQTNEQLHTHWVSENVLSAHSVVYEDAITRLKPLGYPNAQIDQLLDRLFTSPYTANQLRGAVLARQLLPPAYQPPFLARLLTAKTKAVRSETWQTYNALPTALQRQTALLFLEGLNQEFLRMTDPWLLQHPLDRSQDLRTHLLPGTGRVLAPGQPVAKYGLAGFYELVNEHHPFETEGFELLSHPEALVRYYATQWLCQHVPDVHNAWRNASAADSEAPAQPTFASEWLERLTPAFHDAEKLVVTGAVQALQAATGDSARLLIRRVLDAAPGALNRAWLIELFTPTAVADDTAWAAAQLRTANEAERSALYRLLSHIGEPAVHHLVTALEAEKDPARLAELIHAVSQLQHPAALGVLFQLQSHAEPAVRAAAETAAQQLLAPEELYSHLPTVGIGGRIRFAQADYDALRQRKDIRLVPRLIELFIAAPRGPFNRNPLKGRLALRTLINAAIDAQAHLAPAFPALYCKRCLAPAEQQAHAAWETNGQAWTYVRCTRCHNDRFLTPGVRRIVGYIGELPEAGRSPETLYLPLWDAPAQAAQYAYATLARVDVAPGLDGSLDWAISAVVNALKNHHPASQLPPWFVDSRLHLSANTERILAPYLQTELEAL